MAKAVVMPKAGITVESCIIGKWKKKPGDTIAVGIYVKCAGAGNGAWGKIDDAMLNAAKE